jgi:hypothetical protein
MNYSLAVGLSVHQTVSLIMATKPLNVIVGQPTTDTMKKMVEQMTQMVAPVKTSVWGGLHGSLTLVLDGAGYTTITKGAITSTAPVAQPDTANKKITATPTSLQILTLQEETKKLLGEFDLKEVVTNIGVQQLVNSVEEQYINRGSGPFVPSIFFLARPFFSFFLFWRESLESQTPKNRQTPNKERPFF